MTGIGIAGTAERAQMVGSATGMGTHTMKSAQTQQEADSADVDHGGARHPTAANRRDQRTPWPTRTGWTFLPDVVPMSGELQLLPCFTFLAILQLPNFTSYVKPCPVLTPNRGQSRSLSRRR